MIRIKDTKPAQCPMYAYTSRLFITKIKLFNETSLKNIRKFDLSKDVKLI